VGKNTPPPFFTPEIILKAVNGRVRKDAIMLKAGGTSCIKLV